MKEIFARKKQSSVCWNRFQDDAGDLVFVFPKSAANGFDIVERKDDCFAGDRSRDTRTVWLTVSERATPGFYQERISVTMVTTGELDDLVAFGESARQPQARHRRLCAAVHHPDFFDCRHPRADQLGHFHFKRIGNTEADASLRCFANGANDNWRGVSENGRSPTANVIDQFNAIDGPNARAVGALDENWFAANPAKSADRRVYAAWNSLPGASEKVA